MDLRKVEERWMRGERIEGIDLGLNEPVDIVSGPHAPDGGAVICVVALEPEPTYLVELGSGEDVRVPQSALRRWVPS